MLFTLDWSRERRGGQQASTSDAPPEKDVPTIFTAIQEQLGLKLIQAKGPVGVIVIDHIELSSEN
jgi:bla regulator protein blaR1